MVVQYLEFLINSITFAIPSKYVMEILPQTNYTSFNDSINLIEGNLSLRTKNLPIIKVFKTPKRIGDIIICKFEEKYVGFFSDNVLGLRDVEEMQFKNIEDEYFKKYGIKGFLSDKNSLVLDVSSIIK